MPQEHGKQQQPSSNTQLEMPLAVPTPDTLDANGTSLFSDGSEFASLKSQNGRYTLIQQSGEPLQLMIALIVIVDLRQWAWCACC
jgi:hypothetical protein